MGKTYGYAAKAMNRIVDADASMKQKTLNKHGITLVEPEEGKTPLQIGLSNYAKSKQNMENFHKIAKRTSVDVARNVRRIIKDKK